MNKPYCSTVVSAAIKKTDEEIGTPLFERGNPVSIEHLEKEQFILIKAGQDLYRQVMRAFKRSTICPQMVFSLDQLMSSYALSPK